MSEQASWVERFQAARNVGTPLIALETADQVESASTIGRGTQDPCLWWDCAAGVRGVNSQGADAVAESFQDPALTLNIVEFLGAAATRLPQDSVLFIALAHRLIEEPVVVQAILNLREPWKSSTGKSAGSALVMLIQPGSKLPSEMSQDVLLVERPLPTPEELRPIVDSVSEAAVEQLGKKPPSTEEKQRAAEALVGLSAFAAESACALAVNDGGLLPEVLWERKRAMVNQTQGLTLVPPGAETFDVVGGLEAIRTFGERLFRAKRKRPRLIVWIDELEKAIAGAGGGSGLGDTSGTSQDQLGVLLRYQEENQWGGILLVGPPGSGKSMVAKALGATFGVPTIMLDLGALKGSFVGQSEQRVRAAMRIIQALAGPAAFFVATCNRLESVPPELRRRYKNGIWFADLPSLEERRAIWKIHLGKNGFAAKDGGKLVDREWTGAEIRNCCELANQLDITPEEASSYVVPVSKSDPEGIERLRRAADGRFLSISFPGEYRRGGVAEDKVGGGRRMKNAL
jgi:hypothetical protein